MFGGFLVFGVTLQPLSDLKAARIDREKWARTKCRTSAVPFAAMRSGRAADPVGDIAVKVILYGFIVICATILIHGYLFGVAIAPGFPG